MRWSFVLVAAVYGGGCRSSRHSTPSVEGGASHLLSPEEVSQMLAKVGGKPLTAGGFVALLDSMDTFSQIRYRSMERRKALLQEWIHTQLLADEAIAKGYDQDPLTQEALQAALREAFLREGRKGAPTPGEIPEQEVRAFFDQHREDYREPELRRVSVLRLRSAAEAPPLLKKLAPRCSAVHWGVQVQRVSIHPNAKGAVPVDMAGDLGFVSPPGDARGQNPQVPEAVRVAAFVLAQEGDVCPYPVVAEGKMYLVRLTKKVPARERTYAMASRSIRVHLSQKALQQRDEALLQTLRTDFPVTMHNDVLATVQPPALRPAH